MAIATTSIAAGKIAATKIAARKTKELVVKEDKNSEGSEKTEEKSVIGNEGPVELPEIDINSLSE